MEKDGGIKNPLGGFEAIFDNTIGSDDNALLDGLAAEDIDDDLPGNKGVNEDNDIDLTPDGDDEPPVIKPGKPSAPPAKQPKPKPVEEVEETNDVEDLSTEAIAVKGLYTSLAEEFEWEVDEEEELPQTVEELVSHFKEVIAENSVPEYANEQVRDLDEYVRNGGKIEDYFKAGVELDLDNIDLEDEDNQKKIVGHFLREKGLKEAQIAKKITKYEDAGILEDEAEDAIEELKEIKTANKEKLLTEQRKQAEALKAQQQEYYGSVVNEIKGLKDIRGIKVPEADKQVLLAYIFKTDASGKSQYQKDYEKTTKNLIESAYFTMKGDAIVSAAKAQGSNNAVKNFKESLRGNGLGKSRRTNIGTGESSIWDTVSKTFGTSN